MQYILKNDNLTAAFESFGAELISLQDDAGKEYLWYGDSTFWGRHSPVLFPFVGKVKDGTYRYEGKEYAMGQHGFARDMEFTFVSQTEDEIWFVLESTEETRRKYPLDFRLEIGYKLIANTLRVMWKVINPAKEETLHFSIGAHPAFLCPIQEGTEQSQYFLEFDGKEQAEYYSASLENGLRLPEKRTLQLLNSRCQMTEGFFDMGDRGTYIFEDHQVKKVSLVTPDGKPYITVSFDMPLVAVWSPEKKKAPFVCIEPWCGRCDRVDFEGSLKEREWGNSLDAGGVFETHYDICICKVTMDFCGNAVTL